MIPRPYQEEGLRALRNHICTKDTNPCVVIPTGGGKSAMIAWAIQRWHQEYPPLRVCVLAHRKELIDQNSAEMKKIYDGCDIGIYSAGLGRRDIDSPVLFASIDSVYKRAGEFPPWDVIMVDEAHRIPFSGEGKYRRFIKESWQMPQVSPGRRHVGCNTVAKGPVIIGWTATPFRLKGGEICHKDHILQEICYEVSVSDLIADGFLSKVRSKAGAVKPDTNGVRRAGGEYVTKYLAERANDVVAKTMCELLPILESEGRKSTIFFCVDVEHCNLVSRYLRHCGINAPPVTSKTPPGDRVKIVELFKAGKLNGLCNVNVYTEGFDASRVDCVVLLRPTLSPGLYSQMVGRGLRLCNGKLDCLVLDFAGCIEEHGPIDCLGGEPVQLAVCGECREHFSRSIKVCPNCGWRIPKREVQALEAAEKVKRQMHGHKASDKSILSKPEVRLVDAVFVSRRRDPDQPDFIQVSYRTGKSMAHERVCLGHPGAAGKKAREWCMKRPLNIPEMNVNCALEDMFLAQKLNEWTRTITVLKGKRCQSIIGYNQKLEGEDE